LVGFDESGAERRTPNCGIDFGSGIEFFTTIWSAALRAAF
jgi:hypothetical protein